MSMYNNYEKIFQKLGQIEVPEGLGGKIMAKIEAQKIRSAKTRFVFLAITAVASVFAAVPALQYAAREFYQSGFYQYFSLLFSDGGAVMASWKEFALSLAESLPLLGATVFLSIVFILLGSIRLAVKNMKTAFLTVNLPAKFV